MKKFAWWLLGLSFLFGGLGTIVAQAQHDHSMSPPKVLVIYREFMKPGKAGGAHEKTESAFVQAFTKAKWPTHYLTVDSMSGKPRSLFLVGYDSFEAWEKDNQAVQKNATLAAALDHAALADGEMLSETDGGTFTYSPEYSLRAPVDIAHMRYFEISIFHVKPGHHKDWDEIVKLVMAAYEKIPDVHWAVFSSVYGQDDGTYLVFNPMKSLSEVDAEAGQGKQFEEAMGKDGMKKLGELEAAGIESSQTQLFMFNPRLSYVSDEWVKADPDFWKPKMMKPEGMAKKPAEKPAAN